MVGEKYVEELYLSFLKMSFTTSKFLNKINKNLIEKSFEVFDIKNLVRNELLYKKGDDISGKIIVIIEGDLIQNSAPVGERGKILFERELFSRDKLM